MNRSRGERLVNGRWVIRILRIENCTPSSGATIFSLGVHAWTDLKLGALRSYWQRLPTDDGGAASKTARWLGRLPRTLKRPCLSRHYPCPRQPRWGVLASRLLFSLLLTPSIVRSIPMRHWCAGPVVNRQPRYFNKSGRLIFTTSTGGRASSPSRRRHGSAYLAGSISIFSRKACKRRQM